MKCWTENWVCYLKITQVPNQKYVPVVFIIGIKDVVSIDSITFVLISCYDYDVHIA